MRRLVDGVLVLAVGVLFGYIVATFVTPLFTTNPAIGQSSQEESRQARQYMLSLLQTDPASLNQLQPNRDVVSRAMEVLSSQGVKGKTQPISLTYLGGGAEGKLQIHIYAVELAVNGEAKFFPLSLTLLDGKVRNAQ